MLPSLFISHGSPDIRFRDHEVRDFLMDLGNKIEKPKSIIIVSAHWFTKDLEILSNPNPELIYDFYGFQKELYETKYPAKNNLDLVNKISECFDKNNISYSKNDFREGYDHGVWTVLSLMYPDADIPIVQLSLPLSFDIEELMNIGEALKDFREDTLIIGSGNITHNLRDVDWRDNGNVKPYAKEFRDWLVSNLEEGNLDEVKDLSKYPYLKQNHPSLDHLLPLFINIGNSKDKKGESMIENYMLGNLAMDTIIFKN